MKLEDDVAVIIFVKSVKYGRTICTRRILLLSVELGSPTNILCPVTPNVASGIVRHAAADLAIAKRGTAQSQPPKVTP